MLSGHITGDIECKNAVTVLKDAIIKGNIHGESLCCDGETDGNTSVNGKATIKENAVVKGDIICEKISICEGAVCRGKVETNVSTAQSAAKADKKAGLKSEDGPNAQMGVVTDLKQYI